MCISVAMASIVPNPPLKHREYGLIFWADHSTLASTNISMTLKKAGNSEMGRYILSFYEIGIILAIFHLVDSLSSHDWLMSQMKWSLVDKGFQVECFLIRKVNESILWWSG